MSDENERGKPKFEVAAFLLIFGPPPIYRSENIAHYEGMRDQLIGCFAPKDFFELNLVMEMVNDAWQIKRGNWHKALAVERWSQKSLEFQTKRTRTTAVPTGHTDRKGSRGDNTTAARHRQLGPA